MGEELIPENQEQAPAEAATEAAPVADGQHELEIIYDREGCIGAGVCAAVDAANWLMNEDKTKADLIDGSEDGEYWKRTVVVDDDGKENLITSARGCPVYVIKVVDKKTGEVVAPDNPAF